MNTFYNKILSIGMTFIVLFSTSSFSVELHYCCDNLIDIGIFEQAKTCSDKFHKNEMDNCENSLESCCINYQLIKIGHDDLKKSFNDDYNTVEKIFTGNYIFSFDTFLEVYENANTYTEYITPLLFRDFIILHQTFLI